MWAPTRPDPATPGQGWTGPDRLTPPTPPTGWGPVIVRTLTGHELAEITEAGLVRLGVMTVSEVVSAIEAGMLVVPDLSGVDMLGVVESARMTAATDTVEVLSVVESGALGGWQRVETVSAVDSGLAVPPRLAGSAAVRLAESGRLVPHAAGTASVAAQDSGTGGWKPGWSTPGDTDVFGSTEVHIPPETRYVDVILLSGGGGGAGGTQGAPGWDGNGGGAGHYAARRWDRGTGGDLAGKLSITIGGGGAGGSRGGNAGSAGGQSSCSIVTMSGDNAYQANSWVAAAGGAGGSGNSLGGGLSGAQNGKAPGNYTHQGKTVSGGGQNSGTPGGGGKGGGGSFWPGPPGSGSTGARGQAWIRFST